MPPPRQPPVPNRSSSRATQPPEYLPALDGIDEALLAADRRALSLLAVEPARRGRRPAYLAARHRARAPLRLHAVRRRVLLGDLFRCPAPRRARDGVGAGRQLRQCRDLQLAVEALRPSRLALRVRRRRPGLHRAPSRRFRNVACPQVPLPVQHVSVAAWSDEAHVAEGRALYRANFDIADAVLKGRYGYRRPQGGFFLWLDMAAHGGGEEADENPLERVWCQTAAGNLSRPRGGKPMAPTLARNHVRVALVHDAQDHGRGLGAHRRHFGVRDGQQR